MKKEINKGSAYCVETTDGFELIPMDVVGDIGLAGYIDSTDGDRFTSAVESLDDYVSGQVYSIERVEGYLGRLTMPGYMDATDWVFGDSESAVSEMLDELYGDEESEVG
jgi:hypothetical protein